MIYDRNHIIITGGTYGSYFRPSVDNNRTTDVSDDNGTSDCFAAILHLPHQDASGRMTDPHQVSWVRRRQYGAPTVDEFCSDIAVGDGGGILMIGHTGENGLLSSQLPVGSNHASVYGVALELDSSIDLQGGSLFHPNSVQYPIAITKDPSTGAVFVAEIFSDEVVPSSGPRNSAVSAGRNEDLSATGYHLPCYTNELSYSVRLRRLNQNGTTTLQGVTHETIEAPTSESQYTAGWTRDYGTMELKDVRVSSFLYLPSPSWLLLAGYTRGTSAAFGQPSIETSSDDDIDGFLTVIDPATGYALDVLRIESSVKAGNDRILGMCHPEMVDNTSSRTAFLVGTTDGVMNSSQVGAGSASKGAISAFVVKVDLEALEVMWVQQLDGVHSSEESLHRGPEVHGLACAVTQDGSSVFMAGDVLEGAILSLGNDNATTNVNGHRSGDLFVARFSTSSGSLEWAKQIGTSGMDTLARGNNAIATDGNGNLLVMGNTMGSMYRQKTGGDDSHSDIFVLSVDIDNGNYLLPTSGDAASLDIATHEGSTPPSSPMPGEASAGNKTSVPSVKKGFTVATIVLLIILIMCVFAGYFFYRRQQSSQEHHKHGVVNFSRSFQAGIFQGYRMPAKSYTNSVLTPAIPGIFTIGNEEEDVTVHELLKQASTRLSLDKRLDQKEEKRHSPLDHWEIDLI